MDSQSGRSTIDTATSVSGIAADSAVADDRVGIKAGNPPAIVHTIRRISANGTVADARAGIIAVNPAAVA